MTIGEEGREIGDRIWDMEMMMMEDEGEKEKRKRYKTK